MPRKAAKQPPEPAIMPAESAKLQLVYRPLAWFKPYERNPRKNDGAVERMCASLSEFGFPVPCLALSTGMVVDGHLRLKAAAKLTAWPGGGPESIPVILCDGWTPAQVKAFRLLVNRSVTWADWDIDLLAVEFGELKAEGFDLNLTGFDASEIADLLPEAQDGGNESDRLKDQFQVLVICEDEYSQAALLERLNEEGLKCRALIS